MAIPVAYLCIILIWSTTPLALKWSTEDVGFLFAALARMSLGFICVMILATYRRQPMRLDKAAVRVYGAAALGIYGAMICVYWGAQFIPSGWVALLFGLSPLCTTVLTFVLLGERSLPAHKVIAQIFGLCGLAVIFYTGLAFGRSAALGIIAVTIAAGVHALSAVLIKKMNSDLPALNVVAGGLLFALGPYFLTWWYFDGTWPATVPWRALGAIVYLGTIATTAGFTLYYFVLKHRSASQVALIAFVSPITALVLGRVFNEEHLDTRVLLGAGLVLAALFLHEILPLLRAVRRSRERTAAGANSSARMAPRTFAEETGARFEP